MGFPFSKNDDYEFNLFSTIVPMFKIQFPELKKRKRKKGKKSLKDHC